MDKGFASLKPISLCYNVEWFTNLLWSYPLLLFGNQEPSFLLGILIAVLIGMTVHEFAHNYVGHLMGDPVPAREGRLTLNPLVHIYWPGFLMFVLIGFGPLGLAPIAAHRMRNPRWGYLAAVAAGPFSNLGLAIVFGLVLRILGIQFLFTSPFMFNILWAIVVFNVLLFLFNLLPLFPIDGWYIVYALLPPDLAYTWGTYREMTQYVFIGLILLSFMPLGSLGIPDPIDLLIGEPLSFLSRTIVGF